MLSSKIQKHHECGGVCTKVHQAVNVESSEKEKGKKYIQHNIEFRGERMDWGPFGIVGT